MDRAGSAREQTARLLAGSCSRPSRLEGATIGLTLYRPYVPLGSDGQSRMLVTYSAQAHAPLPANRLDIRACHPAFRFRLTEFC